MNRYDIAKSVTNGLSLSDQYARICKGPRAGTVGRITEVRSPYWSEHHYRLAVEGHKPFWVKGIQLELLQDYQEGTHYVVSTNTPVHQDMLGRNLELNQTIVFSRCSKDASTEMVMGTIKRVASGGALYVKVFRVNNQPSVMAKMVRLSRPERAIIIDSKITQEVMMAKLALC